MARRAKFVNYNINLVPKDPFFESPIGKTLKWALSVGRYIVIFTELIVILSFVTRFSLDRQVTDLNKSIEQKRAVVESFGNLEGNVRLAQAKIENYLEIEQQTNIAEIFPALSEITPPSVRLDQLLIQSDTVSFSGLATSQEGLNVLITNIQLSPTFVNVDVGKIESSAEESGLEFSMTAGVERL